MSASGVRVAGIHALGWFAASNAVGLLLSVLLLFPDLSIGEWSYGRWVPVHLNGQLYGWTALPLVAWLFKIYEVHRRWAEAAVWAWTVALAIGCLAWLEGGSSGKIFLDWSGGALVGFVLAMIVLWLALADGWRRVRGGARLAGLIALAAVPWMMLLAASAEVYPPVDGTTGGPTGSSLLGSTLFVIGLMLVLPATLARKRVSGGRTTWMFFALSWVVFALTEAKGGTHHDWWQILSMLILLPWVVLLPRWWGRYVWPDGSAAWRYAMLGWWALLVTSGVIAYFPEVLDRMKFTQGLVAHSHLAMAGFTTSFGASLLSLMGTRVGGWKSVVAWCSLAGIMVVTLMAMGWAESAGYGWMIEVPAWRVAGFATRAACGLGMFLISLKWWMETLSPTAETVGLDDGQPQAI